MPLADDLKFDDAAFAEGEQAFARGLSIGRLIRQVAVETHDPNAGHDGGEAQLTQWAKDQAARERRGAGLVLGYINGFVQAVRRIDAQLNTPGSL